MMENRYYIKVSMFEKQISFMVEADNADQIKEMINPNHKILEITRVG